MAIKRVIIHAGLHKTGSSSIQDTLYYNSRILEKLKILYMTEWGGNQSPIIMNMFPNRGIKNYHYNVVNNLRTDEAIAEFISKNEELLIKKTTEFDYDTWVISGEDISLLSEKNLLDMRNYFENLFGKDIEIKVIIYVRNPVNLAVSLYQQWFVTPGSPKSAKEFLLERIKSLYQVELQRFLNAFNNNELIVTKFEDAIEAKGGLLGHFFNTVGISEEEVKKIDFCRSNEARSTEAVELMAYINKRKPLLLEEDGVFVKNPGREGTDIQALTVVRGHKFDLPYSYKKKLGKISKKDSLWLKENTGIDYTKDRIERKDFSFTSWLKENLGNNRTTIEENVVSFRISDESIEDFKSTFKLLPTHIKKIFLDFFEEKYNKTQDNRLKSLFEKGSEISNAYEFAQAFEQMKEKNEDVRSVSDRTLIIEDFSEIFIDYGKGLSVENVRRIVMDSTNTITIQLSFIDEHVQKFRLDPSLYASVVLIKKLIINNKENNYKIEKTNGINLEGSVFCFTVDDPQIYFESYEEIETLEIEFIIDKGTYPYIFAIKALDYNINRLLQTNSNDELSSLDQKIKKLKKEFDRRADN